MKKNAKKDLSEKIAQAQEIAEQLGIKFVSSKFKEITREETVLVKIPAMDELRSIAAHKILVFDDCIKKLLTLEIKNHYIRGDFPEKGEDGRAKPLVVRHFFVTTAAFGKSIIADVKISQKICLITGKKMVVIDICEIVNAGTIGLTPTHTLKIGALPNGNPNKEAMIPGKNLCVRLEPKKQKAIG